MAERLSTRSSTICCRLWASSAHGGGGRDLRRDDQEESLAEDHTARRRQDAVPNASAAWIPKRTSTDLATCHRNPGAGDRPGSARRCAGPASEPTARRQLPLGSRAGRVLRGAMARGATITDASDPTYGCFQCRDERHVRRVLRDIERPPRSEAARVVASRGSKNRQGRRAWDSKARCGATEHGRRV